MNRWFKPKFFLVGLIVLGLIFFAGIVLGLLPKAKTKDCSKLPKSTDAVVIKMENNQFDPKQLTINVCQTLLFLNLDEDTHQPVSRDFDAGRAMPKFDYFQFQVTKTGSYSFEDKLHPQMTGKIVIKNVK